VAQPRGPFAFNPDRTGIDSIEPDGVSLPSNAGVPDLPWLARPPTFLGLAMRSIVLLGVALIASGGVAPAAPPPTSSTTSGFSPFDLTYLPRTGPQGIIALRPCEIARHLPAHPLAGQARVFLGILLSQVSDCNLEAADPPALADLDECVLGLGVSFTLPTAETQGRSVFGAGTPCCLRTVKPFDWAAAARKWFPRAEKTEHAGRTYLRTPWTFSSPLIPPDLAKRLKGQHLGVFVPDCRTLVLGAEAEIQALLDRLKEGKPALEPPPGWNEVRRDLIAGVLDQRETPCLQGKWPEEPAEGKPIGVLFETLTVSAFGVTVQEGPTGRRLVGRLVATTKDTDSAGRAVDAIKGLVDTYRAVLAQVPTNAPSAEPARMIRVMFDRATLNREGQTVRGQIAVPFALIQFFARAARGPSGEAPPPPPGPVDPPALP
jgi:hypothetical protein